jgi:hypothetical protein
MKNVLSGFWEWDAFYNRGLRAQSLQTQQGLISNGIPSTTACWTNNQHRNCCVG